MSLRLVSAPQSYPVSLEEAKNHLRETSSEFDDAIEAMIEAAVDYCEGFLGRALIDQTWQLTLDRFPCGYIHSHLSNASSGHEIKIPNPPLIEVVSIKYDDSAGVEQTLDPSQYTVDSLSEPGWVVPVGSWPSTFSGINAVRIQFRCGYLDQTQSPPIENVPAVIKAAIKLIVGNLYQNRETIVVGEGVSQIPMTAELLLRPKRIHLSMA